MPKKTPGKLNSPPTQAEFDKLPLANLCGPVKGVFYRLHSLNPASGKAWPALFFSQRGATRFDPATGVGTLYIGSSLVGALMEMFDDRWGPLGDSSRSLTEPELQSLDQCRPTSDKLCRLRAGFSPMKHWRRTKLAAN
jgi:hypothetical protein